MSHYLFTSQTRSPQQMKSGYVHIIFRILFF